MLAFLLILIIIACALLVLIILAQNPKGGGLSNIGAGASQFLGARQTADFLEKSTWYFGVGILAVVVFTYFLTTSNPDMYKTKSQDAVEGFSLPKQSAPQGTKPAPAQPQAPAK
jgi:preprotein translocase subunit SecG